MSTIPIDSKTFDPAVIDWLMDGDPVIRWQVMRDLLDRPEDEWLDERTHAVHEGWMAEFLGYQGADGQWLNGRWNTLRALRILRSGP